MRHAFRLSLLFVLAATTFASTVDTLSIPGTVLGRNVETIVVRPSSYQQSVLAAKRFPVLYLLHCAGGNHLSWLSNDYCEGLAQLADSAHILIVAPFDGTSQSWWLDSPVRSDSKMSVFLIEHLKPYIDSAYTTCTGRENTALAGHSMGGFGALHNAMYHSDVFGVAVGIKSGLDILNPSWPSDFGLSNVLGPPDTNRAQWEWATVMDNAYKFVGKNVAIRLYNGRDDAWFFDENLRFHNTLGTLGVAHQYTELQQTHFTITRDVVRGTLTFCDSVFTCISSARSRRGWMQPSRSDADIGLALSRPQIQKLCNRASAFYTLRGKRIYSFLGANIPRGLYLADAGHGKLKWVSVVF